MSRQNTSVSLKTRQGLFLIMPTMLRKGNIILTEYKMFHLEILNCYFTLVDFKSPCVVLWKKVLRGINVALAEGIWEIKSFISTAQSASCFCVVGSLLLKVFLFFSAACLEYLDYSG